MRKFKVHIIVFVFALLVGGITSYNLGQDMNWDLQNYHFYLGYSLVHNRLNTDIDPGQFETYENPLPSVPGYVLIKHFSPKTAGVLLGAIQGINIWLVFEIALIFLKRVKMKSVVRNGFALFIASLSFFGAASLSEVGNTMTDNLISIPILLALLLVLYSFQQKPKLRFSPRQIRLLAYFIMGIAVGLKLTSAVYAIPLFLGGLVVGDFWLAKIKEALFHGLSIVAGVLVSSGFWFVMLWDKFRNPFFPYYNGIFKSPYYPSVNFIDTRWFHAGIGHRLFYPFYFIHLQTLSSEEPFRDPRLAVLYSLVIVTVAWVVINKLIWKKNILAKWSKEYLVFWVFFILSYIIWEKQFSYYRYLIPVELVTLLAISILIFTLIKNVKTASAIIIGIIILITIFTKPINWGRIPWQPTYFGVTSSQFKNLNDSTIIMVGYDPMSFIVPYFPSSSSTIRIEGDLTSPAAGTTTMQNYIKRVIDQKEKKGTPFFALESSEENVGDQLALKDFGFKSSSCKTIFTTPRINSPDQIRLCTLEKTSG